MVLKVVDDKMGSGKTTMAINMMIDAKDDVNFCYITPFLTEINRVIKDVGEGGGRIIVQPKNYGSGKLDSLKKLILNNIDIASTHALFKDIDNDITELLKINNYVLILDEVLEVLCHLDISKSDTFNLIAGGNICVNDNGEVGLGDNTEYSGKWNRIVAMAGDGRLFYDEDKLLVWCFPHDVFELFSEVYIMTYMFKASLMCPYFKIYNIEYDYLSIDYDTHTLIPYREPVTNTYKDLISIVEDNKINNIGNRKNDLSYSWYHNPNKKCIRCKQMKKNISNYFRNIMSTRSVDFLWTTFKDNKPSLSDNGFRGHSTFCSHNMRAINDFKHKTVLAYTINRFTNPYLVRFFSKRGVKINEDLTALSEMLQWIFRSAIREDKKITIYIPSRRMRELLINWLKGDSI